VIVVALPSTGCQAQTRLRGALISLVEQQKQQGEEEEEEEEEEHDPQKRQWQETLDEQKHQPWRRRRTDSLMYCAGSRQRPCVLWQD
jgi:hypothetical protein